VPDARRTVEVDDRRQPVRDHDRRSAGAGLLERVRDEPEVSLYLAVGDGADLTAEQEAALSALLRSLESGDAEVVGHSKNCTRLSECLDLKCSKMTCNPLQCSSLLRVAASTGLRPRAGT
jgi:hypothetical protein